MKKLIKKESKIVTINSKQDEIKPIKVDKTIRSTWYIHGIRITPNADVGTVRTFGPVESQARANVVKLLHENSGDYDLVKVNQISNYKEYIAYADLS